MIKIDSKKIIIPLIMATMVCLASCSNDGNSGKTDGEEPIVIEPGVVENKDRKKQTLLILPARSLWIKGKILLLMI